MRTTATVVSGAALYSGSMIMLNEFWYKDYPRSGFHLFDDSRQWLQMDKIGHAMTSYHLGKVGHKTLRWAYVDEKKALWWGGCTGLLYLTGIEILDGFSTEWGFSLTDEAANITGAATYIGQEMLWGEQRVKLKFSAHHTGYAAYRPDVLGTGDVERLLKDYNGQTYWISINPSSFRKKENKVLPWLNVAIGHSVSGMVAGDGYYPPYSYYKDFWPRRQLYLSVDIDWERIPVQKPWARTLLGAFEFIKIPAPAIFLDDGKIGFDAFYF